LFGDLVALMATLRGPEGCPWDREQTHSSISLNLLEEAYEAIDAIDRGDPAHLQEELGDVLLQVVFHCQMAAEAGQFQITDVLQELIEKLVGRHPHVFADKSTSPTSDQVLANWEAIKRADKGREGLEEGIPPGLPALVYAHKALRRLAGVSRAVEPSAERLAELASQMSAAPTEEVVGELLFQAAALAKQAGVDPEGALRRRSKAYLQQA